MRSGSAANLVLAVNLAKLLQTSAYKEYPNRIRFCWWAAEEVGLLGSKDYVEKAKNSTVIGERLEDVLVNLNFDMLGSSNYMFGIYDYRTATNTTPVVALPGSKKLSELFRDWFINQNLPWSWTDFSGRSDYGPFLAEGIVAGGLFSGAEVQKTKEERDRYDLALGQGQGGIPNASYDSCYHQACDAIGNINTFAYQRMVQAAAYMLEYLGKQEGLKTWLYPPSEMKEFENLSKYGEQTREYNPLYQFYGINDS
ncbi:unnamed protein product [Didymodactylos carnosus]|uniref:Peptidase M28 domain-containing protein n=1 Tax=Didymodactylos carnosus TaxID=1234261 RepID=A0A8S2FGF1_9BILA|nr:unnamed protein product [Didymodactylos carnosus]CAF4253485.1 unnamed protein product [Didymodactylos carnosus]